MQSLTLSVLLTASLVFGSMPHAQEGKEKMKTEDAASVRALLGRHFTAINELDPEKRKALIAEVYDPHIMFIDPHGVADGRAELDKLYDGIHKRFPGFVFRVVDDIEAHHEYARVHWELGIPGASEKRSGDDFVKIKDGKIVTLIIFINGQTK